MLVGLERREDHDALRESALPVIRCAACNPTTRLRTLGSRPGDALALLDEARALNPRHEQSALCEWTIIAAG